MVVRQAAVSECGPPRGRRRASFHCSTLSVTTKRSSQIHPSLTSPGMRGRPTLQEDLILPIRLIMILAFKVLRVGVLHIWRQRRPFARPGSARAGPDTDPL